MVIRNKEYRKPEMAELIIERVEKPMLKILEVVEGFLPEPRKEDTNIYNIKVLVDTYELFKRYYHRSIAQGKMGREKALCALIKWAIVKMDRDSHYRGIGEWWVEQLIRRGWDRRPYLLPSPDYWDEPQPYGGGYPVTDELEGEHVGHKYLYDIRKVEEIGKESGV